MRNFWITEQGSNTLKGVEGDEHNPPRLPSYLILEFLQEQQDARDGLLALLPSMLPEEQERLNELIESFPSVMKAETYEQIREDNFQASQNALRINNPNSHLPRGNAQPSSQRSGLVVRLK